jgi:hypothetical protein
LSTSFNVDLGNAIPYFVEKFLELVGKDMASTELREWFAEVQRIGLQESSTVMAVGMHTPLPLEEIYQPTKLLWESPVITIDLPTGVRRQIELPEKKIPPAKFLDLHLNAVIFAGPGWGKTTFLHYAFLHEWRRKAVVPILFTLRRPSGLADFRRFVESVNKLDRRMKKSADFLLLVDGYDEVSTTDRKIISDLLLRYSVSGTGNYLLTCRDFYDVYDLKVPQVHISEFQHQDQLRFVEAFTKAYGAAIPAQDILADLEARGLGDFLKHPLLLALVCIVKTGRMNLHSRSVLGLISRAIDTLSFRWDEGKGVARESRLPLDGRDRINCLMRVAYHVHEKRITDKRAIDLAAQQLELMSCEHLDPKQVLMETARFYGIFVPAADGGWEFVHKTLQDYLAAKFWVESGLFAPKNIKEWDTRAAYARPLFNRTAVAISLLPDSVPYSELHYTHVGCNLYLLDVAHCYTFATN